MPVVSGSIGPIHTEDLRPVAGLFGGAPDTASDDDLAEAVKSLVASLNTLIEEVYSRELIVDIKVERCDTSPFTHTRGKIRQTDRVHVCLFRPL